MSDRRPAPLPNCYWLPDAHVLAGEYPGAASRDEAARKLRSLREAGVDTFIDLTEAGELEPYESVLAELADDTRDTPTYKRVAVRDVSVPRPEQMRRILDLIDAEVARGRTVYVHCWGGVGRTGTVVGCYLVRHGLTGQEALDRIAVLWQGMEKRHRAPKSPETDAQRSFVLGWASQDRPSGSP
jgi:rhodanese/phosphatase family protein